MAITSSTLTVRGLRFETLSAGPSQGELVLLLHGFPQSASCWRPALNGLAAAGYRAVAVTQRGYSPGAVPEDVEAYHMRELVSDVAAFADALQREPFHLVGHDWGGMVAWAAAARLPERVRTLTSVTTPHPAALSQALRSTEQRVRMSYVALLRAPYIPEALFNLASGELAVRALSATGLERSAARRDVDHLRTVGPTGAFSWYRATDRATFAVDTVRVPTLHVWADGDPVFGRTVTEATAAFVDAPYHLLELQGASHWVPDQHWEDVADVFADHLREHSARVTRSSATR